MSRNGQIFREVNFSNFNLLKYNSLFSSSATNNMSSVRNMSSIRSAFIGRALTTYPDLVADFRRWIRVYYQRHQRIPTIYAKYQFIRSCVRIRHCAHHMHDPQTREEFCAIPNSNDILFSNLNHV